MGSTSTTVAVIVPEKVLALSVAPSPEKSLADDVPTPALSRARSAADNNGKALTLADMELVRLAVELDTWLAVTRSTIWMVTMSPTIRARASSKAGRYEAARYKLPVAGAFAARAGGAISVWTGSGKSTDTGCGNDAQAPRKISEILLKPNFSMGLLLQLMWWQTGFMKHLTAYSCPSFWSIWSEVWIALEFIS